MTMACTEVNAQLVTGRIPPASRKAVCAISRCRHRTVRHRSCSTVAFSNAEQGKGPAHGPVQHVGMCHQHADLDQAEEELAEFCSHLPPEEDTEKCWQAYAYLENKREEAAESVEKGKRCVELDTLNDMAHQLLSTGNVEDLVVTFSTLARVEGAEQRQAEQRAELQQPCAASARVAASELPLDDDAASGLHALFAAMDANGDGRLLVPEFGELMRRLGSELDDKSLAMIVDAMGVHGFIDEEQLREIVEAVRLDTKDEVATVWRHSHYHKPTHSPWC